MNYKAPYSDRRLRDKEGEALRPGAKKSVEHMQMLLLQYTKAGEGEHRAPVLDLYGGSMSMGLACLTLGRAYSDMGNEWGVYNAAALRLQRFV